MINLIDKDELGFDKKFCHKVIRKRHKFIVDNNLPRITFSNLIPQSHCPINLLNNVNDEIYEKIEKSIIHKMSDVYKINVNDLEHNICYYVENNIQNTKIYNHIDHCNYSYGYLILLNENTYYEGGEIYINDNLINLDNKILFFKLQDAINITNILEGEQHKLIGFVNYCFNENNDTIGSFRSKKLNIFKTQNYIASINDVVLKNNACHLYKILLDPGAKLFEDKINSKKYYILNDEMDVIQYGNLFTSQINVVKDFLSKFNLDHTHMLPVKLCKYENIRKLLSFSPIIQTRDSKYNSDIHMDINDNIIKNTYIKFTLFVCINDVEGKIIFPNQNFEYDLYEGAGFIIPNNIIFSFYITLHRNNIIEDCVSFAEMSFY